MSEKKYLQLESVNRISKIPVIESGVQVASGLYERFKNTNNLVRWSLDTVEGGVNLAIDRSLTFPLLELPLSIADSIVCKGLDTVQHHVPAINLPPQQLIDKTKDYVSTKIVNPVLKRADSVKQFGIQEANKYSELAATRIDTALDVADQYVDKYLPPDSTDNSEGKEAENFGDNKKLQTIEHVNRFSRKLQRRLTKRTLAEARALRKQGADVAQVLFKLAELLVKDPKQFAAKMKALWEHLSQDEPENQVPPGNLEQLIAMLTRESARRIVHLTNYAVAKASKLPYYTNRTFNNVIHQANYYLDHLLQTVHLQRAKEIAVTRAEAYISYLYVSYRELEQFAEKFLEMIISNIKSRGKKAQDQIPLNILSPVAQSPERSQQVSQEKKQENQSTPTKKPRKLKSNTNETNNQESKTFSNEGDENSNKQPVMNGDASKSPE